MPDRLTRNKNKLASAEETREGASNTPGVDAAATTTTTTTSPRDETGGVGDMITTTLPNLADTIIKELPNTKISGEMLPVVNIIIKVIQSQFDSYLAKIDLLNNEKDKNIEQLKTKVNHMETKIRHLESMIDEVDQYERRDTVIISGPNLPDESLNENPSDVIVNTIKQHLHVNMTHADINVAHRLGPKSQGKKRPVIVKLQNRLKKSELVQACINIRPQLHINESLTPKRRSIFNTIRKIRSEHRNLFQQCYTSDGKIIVKLKSAPTKYTLTTEEQLHDFVNKHPIFKDSLHD